MVTGHAVIAFAGLLALANPQFPVADRPTLVNFLLFLAVVFLAARHRAGATLPPVKERQAEEDRAWNPEVGRWEIPEASGRVSEERG